ncbi:hypothetical protein [Nonomuraea sp. NEAU-A123]|uniref:hypothetical protein n=1 Tax=Nonomuraea sp. NEAU-A123 TaxID=2839649 RepID=UPI002032E235|nr:hypothetical protein [Nonomuraea sp. NEAU-A123]
MTVNGLGQQVEGDFAELPEALGGCGGGDGVAAQEVDVGVAEAGGALVLDWDALGTELVDGGRTPARAGWIAVVANMRSRS